jgi:hypothetical protein
MWSFHPEMAADSIRGNMPTLDRTTIKSAIDELVNKLRRIWRPILRRRASRFARSSRHGRSRALSAAFLTVRAVRARAASVVDDDKVVEVTVELRIVADIVGVDPLTAVYDQMGAVEDYLDSIRDTGIIDGSAGFDERTWALETVKLTSGARVSTVTAQQTLIVKVQRGFNRAAAV